MKVKFKRELEDKVYKYYEIKPIETEKVEAPAAVWVDGQIRALQSRIRSLKAYKKALTSFIESDKASGEEEVDETEETLS